MRKMAMDQAPDASEREERGKFFRKGKVGDWEENFKSKQSVEKWKAVIEEKTKGTGIAFITK